MTIRVDRRRLTGTPDPEGMALAAASLDTLFEEQIGTGKALFRIHHANAFIFADAASIEEIAWRHRVDGLVASTLLNLGYALHYVPTLEGEVRNGSIPLVSAAQLGRLVREGALEPLEEWLELARTYSERDLRAAVRRRLAEVRQGREDLRERTFHLTQELNRKFDWAKELASKKEGSALTDEKALDRVTTHYLDTFDPSWPEKVAVKVPGEDPPPSPPTPPRDAGGSEARLPSPTGPNASPPSPLPPPGSSDPATPAPLPAPPVTPTSTRSRYVPADVRRALQRLYGGRCAVPGCRHRVYVVRAHVRAKRDGGGQDLGNQVPLCTRHHTLFDAGRLRVWDWLPDGRARFETSDGTILSPRQVGAQRGTGGTPGAGACGPEGTPGPGPTQPRGP